MKTTRKFPISPLLMVGVVFLLLICLGPQWFATADPLEGSLKLAYQAPNGEHYCGTDIFGRDIFSRIIYGVRLSLVISLATVGIILCLGTAMGVTAGYLGGTVDTIVMGVCNILISCPSMVLAIAMAGILGASVENAMIAIFVVTVSKYIRLSRSLVLQVNNEEYIKAARMTGARPHQVLIRHILPNITPTLLVTAATDVGTIILELSALSFLGFGVPAPLPELGLMMNEGRPYLMSSPWMVFCPGIAIFMIVSIVNMVSDQFRDWMG